MSVRPMDPMEAAILDAVFDLEAREARRDRRLAVFAAAVRVLYWGAVVAAMGYLAWGAVR